ncbi:MAG: GyrI-like domain-containing protein [Clostridiales bacterium]
MEYNIEIKNIESIKVAFMKFKGHYTEAGKYMPEVFKSVQGKTIGIPFFAYYLAEKKTGLCEIDLCVPTNIESTNKNGITIKELPGFKAACVTHIGPYDSVPMAYEAIDNYLKKEKLDLQLPWREVFIKGPGLVMKGNPKKYITEIIFPLKEVE